MNKISLLICIMTFTCFFAQNTIFWTVQKEGNPHTSYLLGTYHQMGNSYVDSLKSVTRALKASQISIFENIDTGENLVVYLNSRPENFGYKEKLGKKYLKNLEEIAKNWKVPVSKLSPPELLMKLEQVYFETHCGTIKPTDSSKLFDNYLINIAKKNSVQILGLESNELMTSYINQQENTEWKEVKNGIYYWLDNIVMKKENETLCRMAYAYKKQKFDYQLDTECAETVILSSRNAVWLPIIKKNIDDKSSFIAVGYAHLTGKCGLVNQLRDAGYKVEPVYNLHQ